MVCSIIMHEADFTIWSPTTYFSTYLLVADEVEDGALLPLDGVAKLLLGWEHDAEMRVSTSPYGGSCGGGSCCSASHWRGTVIELIHCNSKLILNSGIKGKVLHFQISISVGTKFPLIECFA